MIHIDGSHEEGGGQIIRTALALSTLTGKSFRADKIRHNRPKPGLKQQHLTCISALEELSFAKVSGAEPSAESFEFIPGKVIPRTMSIDIGTAGSITLLLQSLLLPCMFADGKVRLKIRGGTDTKWSIPIDYFINVIMPNLVPYANLRINDIQRGYYPKGGGLVDITIKPLLHRSDDDFLQNITEKPIDLAKKRPLNKISGISSASQELRSAEVAKRQASGAKKKLSSHCPVKIIEEYQETASVGTVITLWNDSSTMGSDSLGEPKKRAEAVGAEAGSELLLLLCSDAAVDNHLADNLIPLLALTGGIIRTDEITGHILSNIYVCEKFLGCRFQVDKKEKIISR